MTTEQKTTARTVLNNEISSTQEKDGSGRYTQIMPYDVDGVHAVSMNVYDGPDGTGFIRQVDCHGSHYQKHTGPGTHPDGWTTT